MKNELIGCEHPDEFTQANEVIEQIGVPGYHAIDLQLYLLLAEDPFDTVYPGLLNPHYREVLNPNCLPTNEVELADTFFNELLLYSIRKYLGIIDSPMDAAFVPNDKNFNILYELEFNYIKDFSEEINSYLIALTKDFKNLLETYTTQRIGGISSDIKGDLQKANDFQQQIRKYIASEFGFDPTIRSYVIKMLKHAYKKTDFDVVITEKLNREVEFWRKFAQGTLEEQDIQEELEIRRSMSTGISSE